MVFIFLLKKALFAEIRNLSDAHFAVNFKHELFFAVESYIPPAVKFSIFPTVYCIYARIWICG